MRPEKQINKATMDERWDSAKDLFALAVKNSEIRGKSILLVDDICTSGATLSRCTDALSDIGGATKVAAFVAGRRHDTNYPV